MATSVSNLPRATSVTSADLLVLWDLEAPAGSKLRAIMMSDFLNSVGGTLSTGLTNGNNGYSPVWRIVEDGDRAVIEVVSWTGGNGAMPATGYIGTASELVDDIEDAADIRGPTGLTGPAPTINNGTIETGAPGSDAELTLTQTAPGVYRLDGSIPEGEPGEGNGDVVGPASAVNNQAAIFNGPTGKLLKAVTLATVATTGAYSDLSGKPTLGTAAALNSGTSSGNVPVLDGSGKLLSTVVPSIAITDTFVVASQAAMLALTAERGDVAIRSDLNKTFILSTDSPTTLADWKEMLTPTDVVLSVAGLTGAVAASALRSALSLVIGTDVQAYNALLAALAGLTTANNKGLRFTGSNAVATYDLTAFALTILDDADAASVRTTISAEPLGELVGINTQTASYTAALTDKGKVVELNNASANNFTIPPNSTVAFPVPTRIDVVQYGAGQTTVVAGAGVTIRSAGAKLKLTGQYSGASLYKRATDEWVIVGDLTT